jgi:hypothetical protein
MNVVRKGKKKREIKTTRNMNRKNGNRRKKKVTMARHGRK